jgi:hypothetical protein
MSTADPGIQLLIQTFELIEDPLYPKMKAIANLFKPGKYTVKQIFTALERRFRQPMLSDQEWFAKANKTLDGLVYYELLEYKDGYYHYPCEA